MKKFLFLIALFTLMGGANSVKAEALIVKTPVILTGSIDGCNPGPCTYGIQMQGWQQFIAYEDATGVSFDEDSYMQFDLAETVNNGAVRVTFTFSDESTQEAWWCLGIGGDDEPDGSTHYNHDFDNSKFWMKKGLGANFDTKKTLNITKVVVQNFNYDSGNSVVTYKVNGGTICGAPMTIKNDNTKVFGFLSGVFSPTTALKNIFKMENFEVSDYQKLVIEFGAATPSRWAIVTAGGFPPDLESGITKKEITLTGANLSEFSIFNWDANPSPINISKVYLYKEVSEIVATEIYEAPAGTTDINDVAGTYTELKINYPKVISGEAATLCGDGDGGAENKNADISDYDYLCFEITEVSGGTSDLRVWVWDGEKVVTLRPHPVADYADVKDWTAGYSISTAGTYAVKVADYNKLKGAKTNWGSSATLTVSEAYLGKGTPVEYVPSGKYHLSGFSGTSASLEAALEDPNATFYDASGVLGTDVELTATNKNAIFKANAGVLANTKNVIVGGTCATLALTDGNYPFKAYDTFTATNVSYNREFKAGKKSTVCLPFALTPAEAAAAGKFYELSDVNDGNTGFIFTDVTSSGTTAYKPYIFEATENGTPFSAYSGKSIAATPTSFTGEAVEGYTLTGVLAGSSDVAADNEGKTVYGWSGNDGNEGAFVKVGTGVAIDPFRAYVVYNGGGASLARMAARFVSGSVTGINEVSETQNVLNPDRKYIEGNNIVIVKNGVKFNAAGQLLK